MTQRRMFDVAGKVAGRMLHRYWRREIKGANFSEGGKREVLWKYVILVDWDSQRELTLETTEFSRGES